MKLYFVRHGESEANVLNEFSNGPFKHGLTEKGKQQAFALARRLRSAPVTQIFTSPILRAVQTAAILAHELGVPAVAIDALREYGVGVLEGKSDAASWQTFWQVSDAWLVRHDWGARIEGGESFLDIKQRFVPFIERLVQEHQSSPDEIVLVGHGGTYRCMLPLVLNNVDFQFVRDHPMDHTTAVIAQATPQGLVCLTWGETIVEVNHDNG
jgi:2,3-bisphosphoglycerate-dependent phosphoglycerate mutase